LWSLLPLWRWLVASVLAAVGVAAAVSRAFAFYPVDGPGAPSEGSPAEADTEIPIVEVGATVHAREEGSGKCHAWTIVSTRSDPSSGKVSTDTAVAKALLGHRVGDTVTVGAGVARRYAIDRIDAAPAKPTSAPSAAATAQPSVSTSDEIEVFGPGQDAEYEEWVRRNSGGYVLKRRDRLDEGYMLHLAECSHLGLTAGSFTMRTGNPRRCSRSRQALVHWCRDETGSPPVLCGSCFS
jgi:hypothetical protein